MLDWISKPTRMRGQDADAPTAAAPAQRPGLLGPTRIATPEGWRRADTLVVGDPVVTFDSGVQPLRSIVRRIVAAEGVAPEAVVVVPAGLLGNRTPLHLMPGQGVLVESDLAERAYGDPFALLPASALRPLPGVTLTLPEAPVVAVTLGFADDEVVFAAGHALVHCPGAWAQPATLDAAVRAEAPRYAMLPPGEAHMLATSLAQPERAPQAIHVV